MSQVLRSVQRVALLSDSTTARRGVHSVAASMPSSLNYCNAASLIREGLYKKCHRQRPALKIVINQSHRPMSVLSTLMRKKKIVEDKKDEEDEVIPEAKSLPLFDDSPKALTEEEIEAKRNISRLSPFDNRLVRGQHPYVEPMNWIHHTVLYKRKLFGKYGESSGVNPGILWPTRENLEKMKEYESICHPFTVQQMVEKKRLQRQKEQEEIDARTKEVEANMEKLEQYKQELLNKQAAKEKEADAAKERREKLMEEVRRHFGYSVDPRDDRFQEMLAKKEKEQRKNMKEARKLEKQRRMLEKLEGKAPEKQVPKKPQKPKDDDDDED